MRVNATRLVAILALHHAKNFTCDDTNIEVELVLELGDDGTTCNGLLMMEVDDS